MFKLLVFLSLFQWSSIDFNTVSNTTLADCPSISNLEKTGQSGTSFTYGWSGSGTQYRVWYVRQEDSYFSGYAYTSNTSYTFTGLSAGHYTFYFQTVCDTESSNFIGIEDSIG